METAATSRTSCCARVAVAHALGTLRLEPEATVPELSGLLREASQPVFRAVVWAIAAYGARVDATATRRLLKALQTALVECEDDTIATLAQTLSAVADDPEGCIRQHFNCDSELKRLALKALAAQRPPPADELLTDQRG